MTTSPVPEQVTRAEAERVITSLGFSIRDLVEYPDFYLFEGDISLTKAEIAEMVARLPTAASSQTPGRTEQAVTAYILNRPVVSNVTVFIDPSVSVPGADDWHSAFTTSMTNWTALSGSIMTFTEVFSSSGANIVVTADGNVLADQVAAMAQFPANSDHAGDQIKVNLDYNNNQTLNSSQKQLIAAHELGHCVSFRHTNWSALGETAGIEIGHGVPTSDAASVMNGYTAGYSWNGFSTYDVLATELIYPQWADYAQLGGAVWVNTDAMTSWGGNVYLVQNSRFYRVSPTDGTYTQLGGAVWPGTDAMTSYGSYVYLVENSRFYRVNPNDGTYTQLGGAVWAGTEAMTSLGSYVYLVENSRIYRVSPTDGSYLQIGSAVWGGTNALASLNGYLYLVQNSRLYKVDPTSGAYTQLGGTSWPNTNAMTANSGSLYIVQNDLYFKVSGTDGTYTRLGGIAWAGTYAMTPLGVNNYITENSRFYRIGIN